MASTFILRKSASSLAPLACRLLRGQRSFRSVIFTAINNANVSRRHSPSSMVPTLQYSSATKRSSLDESLVLVIESEIKCLQEADEDDRVENVPSGFPFEIEDHPGLQILTLKRTYQGEEIEVEVHMPDLVTGEDGDHDEDDGVKSNQCSLPMVVSVSKKSGPNLEFSCTALPDEIEIDTLAVKHPDISDDEIAYRGPEFHDLDENLQKAFHRYLEMRGIKPSTINFLHEYMINKNCREELLWMKKLKKFIEA